MELSGPRWKGENCSQRANSDPMSEIIAQLQVCLSNSESAARPIGTDFLLETVPELTDLLNRTSFGTELRTSNGSKGYFQLSPEETFYLQHSLKCLKVSINNANFDVNDSWNFMRSRNELFPIYYRAYMHLRSKNWVVKSGTKNGVDYVVYRHHPERVHSEYAVIVDWEKEKGEKEGGRLRVWSDLHCAIRACNGVAKAVLLLTLMGYEVKFSLPELLERMTVDGRQITRWLPSQCRDDCKLELKVEEEAAMDGEEVSKVEGETRRRRKGKERGENPARNRQQNNFLLEDDSEEIHFNPYLSSSPSSSDSSQIRTEVSKARWVEEIGMAEVIEKKGSMWVTTGVIRNSKLYCHIEEIGYLAQIGALVLLDEGDNVMGFKDIFTKCADRRYGCTWESFVAYRHLKSLGFIIGRHSQPWSVKHDNLKPNSDFTADMDFIGGRIEELQIGAANLIFDIHQPNSKFKKTDPGAPSFIVCLVGDRPPIRKEVEYLEEKCKLVPFKFCHVSHDDVRFFSFAKVSLPVLP